MKAAMIATLVTAAAVTTPSGGKSPTSGADAVAETLIRQRVEGLAKAIGARDIDGVMSHYAAGIVSFDLNPPLRYSGLERKRRGWQQFFATYTGPVAYELRELKSRRTAS